MTKNGVFTGCSVPFRSWEGLRWGRGPRRISTRPDIPIWRPRNGSRLQAWDKLVAAQQANKFDLGGHARKAKEALDPADREMKLAAETANRK
jgi:hypothetical protein